MIIAEEQKEQPVDSGMGDSISTRKMLRLGVAAWNHDLEQCCQNGLIALRTDEKRTLLTI